MEASLLEMTMILYICRRVNGHRVDIVKQKRVKSDNTNVRLFSFFCHGLEAQQTTHLGLHVRHLGSIMC
jgi:hypothetical protein